MRSIFCPPGAAAPPLRADCVEDGGYEELPVSEPPHVPRGLFRGDGGAAPRAGWRGEEAKATTTLAAEQEVVVAPAPDGGGVGAGAWFALACASVYGKVAGPFRS